MESSAYIVKKIIVKKRSNVIDEYRVRRGMPIVTESIVDSYLFFISCLESLYKLQSDMDVGTKGTISVPLLPVLASLRSRKVCCT